MMEWLYPEMYLYEDNPEYIENYKAYHTCNSRDIHAKKGYEEIICDYSQNQQSNGKEKIVSVFV